MTVNLANAFLGLAFRWPERIAVEAYDTKLTFRHNGIDRRLTDVHGHVIEELIA